MMNDSPVKWQDGRRSNVEEKEEGHHHWRVEVSGLSISKRWINEILRQLWISEMNYKDDHALITKAAVFAAEAHHRDVRKELNEPYIVHPLRVGAMAAQLGQHPNFIAAAYLHDVVEDTAVPMATLESLFPADTVILVKAMTKWWGTGHPSAVVMANKDAYYQNLINTPGGPLLKVLDRIDNLRDFAKAAHLAPSTHRWAAKYAAKTRVEFVPVLAVLQQHPDNTAYERALRWYDVALVGLEIAL
jgi:(p)ppGpp synthase/HD superfamily hydrolase